MLWIPALCAETLAKIETDFVSFTLAICFNASVAMRFAFIALDTALAAGQAAGLCSPSGQFLFQSFRFFGSRRLGHSV